MKRTTLLLVTLLASAYGFAQLNVRNNAFIYAKDEIVFVENNVNLQEGTTNFYLRNDAQLIQGVQTIANSGAGNLSTLEPTKETFYGYNAWSLPVGGTLNPSAAMFTNTGVIGDGFTTFGAINYIGPYTPNAAPGQTEIAKYWLWGYDAGTQYADWKYLGDLTTTLEEGKGYLMKGAALAAGNTALDFRGLPNSNDISVPILADQTTMIGNPYPSAIDARDFIHDANNITVLKNAEIFYYYHPDSGSHNITSYTFAYASYTINAAGTIETNPPAPLLDADITGDNPTGAGSVGNSAMRYIPISQGFFIDAASGIPGGSVVNFNNTMRNYVKRTDAGNTLGYRTSNTNRAPINNRVTQQQSSLEYDNFITYNTDGYANMPEGYNRFRFNVTFIGTQVNRQLIHTFNDELTNGYDPGYETSMSPIANGDAYFPNAGRKLNGIADAFDIDMKIPVVLNTASEQLINFSLVDIQNFDASQPIYLHDKNTDEYFDLTQNDHQMTVPSGVYAEKFELVFKNANIELIEIATEELGSFSVFQNNSSATLTLLNPNELEISNVSVYDVTGKRIFDAHDVNSSKRYEISTKNLSEGVYIVKVGFDNGTSTSKKVIVGNKN